MRYKIVPAPADRTLLVDVHEALPLVPGSVEECCTRIRDRTSIPSRDEAREWLTFARALGLATDTDRGYHRVRDRPDDAALATAFVENVFPAEEVLAALTDAGEPLEGGAVFEAVHGVVPRWERSRHADWESEWRDRIGLVLGWCVTLGLAERTESGYTASEP